LTEAVFGAVRGSSLHGGVTLGRGDTGLAEKLVDEIIDGRFQRHADVPELGQKSNGESQFSCFFVENRRLHGVHRTLHNSALQLSKRGGGVAVAAQQYS